MGTNSSRVIIEKGISVVLKYNEFKHYLVHILIFNDVWLRYKLLLVSML